MTHSQPLTAPRLPGGVVGVGVDAGGISIGDSVIGSGGISIGPGGGVDVNPDGIAIGPGDGVVDLGGNQKCLELVKV